MGRTRFAVLFAAMTLVLGVFLPMLPIPGGPWENIVWSCIDGLGVYLIDLIHPRQGSGFQPADGPAILFWPWLIALAAFLTVRLGVRSARVTLRQPFVAILVGLLAVTAPVVMNAYGPLAQRLGPVLPLWWGYYETSY